MQVAWAIVMLETKYIWRFIALHALAEPKLILNFTIILPIFLIAAYRFQDFFLLNLKYGRNIFANCDQFYRY